MNSARVHTSDSALHGAMAPQQRRMPVAGKIRPGIKVLTRKAEGIPGAVDTYRRGVAAGASFDDIERALKQLANCPPYPLTPRNAPYFRVVQSDFSTPNAAAEIIARYGEGRDGDAEPQLYSFPLVFPSDDIDLIFRENFEAWKASELVHWSEPDPQTGTLQCMRRVEFDANAKRRQWGGRPTEAVGPCNPNACDLFGAGHCKHVGSLYFWVPGITGVGLIELTFTSIYASLDVAEKLELVRAGLGHVKGTHNGRPIFRISKVRDNVSRIDWETGKAQRTEQWIIRLEADLDMVAVLSGGEAQNALPTPAPATALPAQSAPVFEHPVDPVETPAETVDTETGEVTPPPESPEPPKPRATKPTAEAAAMRKTLSAQLKEMQWSGDDLADFLEGNGFSRADASDAGKLAEILAKLKPIVELNRKRKAQSAAAEAAAINEEIPF